MRAQLLASVASFTVNDTTDLILSTGHDVREGDTVKLSTTNLLPEPFESDAGTTVYYAINVNADDFQLSYTAADEALSHTGVTANVTTDSIGFTNHGYEEDDRVLFTTTNTLPAGISPGVQYYVVGVSQNFFQISLTLGGAPVDITDTGTGTHTAATGSPIDITNTGTGLQSYESGVALDGSSTAEIRRYVLTYVAEYGNVLQESAPSLPSIDLVTWRDGQRVILTSMPTGPGVGTYNINRKRLYRVNTSDSGAEYQFLAEMDLASTEFIDDLPGSELGEVIESEEYDMPPYDLVGIKPMANGMLIGIRVKTKEVCYAEPYRPHAWPTSYRGRTHEPPVGIGVYGTMDLQPFSFGIIATEKFPYTVRGKSPDSMVMDQAELPYPCVSKRSIVDMGKFGVMWASSDGLVMAGSGGIDLSTRLPDTTWAITPVQWRALQPKTMVAARWDQYYMCFYDSGAVTQGFLFDPWTRDFIWLDDHASAIYLNPMTGQLHIFSNSKIQTWSTGAALTATWKDRARYTTAKASFSIARCDAAAYTTLTMVVDADGTERVNQAIADGTPFRINTGQLANLFELELQTASVVRSIEMATSLEDLLGE